MFKEKMKFKEKRKGGKMKMERVISTIREIQGSVEKRKKRFIKSVMKNHPNTIIPEEQHGENIMKMFYLLNMYLNGNPEMQKEVQRVLDMWKNLN